MNSESMDRGFILGGMGNFLPSRWDQGILGRGSDRPQQPLFFVTYRMPGRYVKKLEITKEVGRAFPCRNNWNIEHNRYRFSDYPTDTYRRSVLSGRVSHVRMSARLPQSR